MSMKLQLLSSLNVFVHNENLNQWVFQARCVLTNVLFLIIQNLIKCHEWQGWLNQHFQYYSVQYLLWNLLIVTLGYISKCNKVKLKSILCELKQKQFLKYFNLGFHCFKLCLLMFTFVFIFLILRLRKTICRDINNMLIARCTLRKWTILWITVLHFSCLAANF